MNCEPPLVLAVASGKGGVGKTMLTVACAHELSLKGRTLLLDLDFFNRGLTGLLREGKDLGAIDRPAFLGEAPSAAAPWCVLEVASDLIHVSYPDLLPQEIARIEALDVLELRDSLREFVLEVAAQFGCSAVVLDCHGGPDRTSFAAALLADHTLLISEPDRITFYGTLNFLRQLERVTPEGLQAPDIRLVFNKVLPALRTRFLYRLYDDYLREEFAGRDLLAIFPLEVHLTKAFEETAVLTAVYPHSLLARKMRVLLRDLLITKRSNILACGITHLNRIVRLHRRRTLGKTPWFLELQSVFTAIGIVAVTLTIMFFSKDRYMTRRAELRSCFFDIVLCAAFQDPDFQRALASAKPEIRDEIQKKFESAMTTRTGALPSLQYQDFSDYDIAERLTGKRYSLTLETHWILTKIPIRAVAGRYFGHTENFYRESAIDNIMGKLELGIITLPDQAECSAAEECSTIIRAAIKDPFFAASLWATIAFSSIQEIAIVAGAWTLLAALWGYQTRIDIALTRTVRRRQFFKAGLITAGALGAWALPIYCVGATWNFLWEGPRLDRMVSWCSVLGGAILASAMVILVSKQIWLLWRVTARERCVREAGWRCLLLGMLLVSGVVLRALSWKVFYG